LTLTRRCVCTILVSIQPFKKKHCFPIITKNPVNTCLAIYCTRRQRMALIIPFSFEFSSNEKAFNVLKNSLFRKILSRFRLPGPKASQYGWSGDYASWQAACDHTTGYDQANILKKTLHSLLKIKSGEAVYERDSVLFSHKEYPYPLISCLLNIASAHNNTLRVVDFGGSLGSTWFQVRDFLSHLDHVQWHVVEQKAYVDAGKAHFEDNILKFHYTLEQGCAAAEPYVILLSSVVQYLDNPHQFLSELAGMAPEYIIFDRTAFMDTGGDRLTIQRVPPSIYEASYPSWFFNQKKFLTHFAGYSCLAEFSSYVGTENVLLIDGKPLAKDKGFFLKKTL
jgi:putative methyltransferase (TIGR04325 family)